MEISKLGETGIKIKSKIATIVVDPTVRTEGDVVIILDPTGVDSSLVDGSKVVVQGPGEYEVLGVSITGERVGSDVMYRLDDETYKIVLASSSIAATAKEEEGDTALVLKAVAPLLADTLSSFVQDVCVVFGVNENIPTSETVKKIPKVNLRRMEDLKGSIVVLAKE